MKPFPCIESTLDVTYGSRTVRLWINRSDVPSTLARHVSYIVTEIKEKLVSKIAVDELIMWLAALPNVNAVQVLERDEEESSIVYGTVVYTVPFEDVHG